MCYRECLVLSHPKPGLCFSYSKTLCLGCFEAEIAVTGCVRIVATRSRQVAVPFCSPPVRPQLDHPEGLAQERLEFVGAGTEEAMKMLSDGAALLWNQAGRLGGVQPKGARGQLERSMQGYNN